MWGTKQGSRQIFAESGVPHPDGSNLARTPEELAIAAANLWKRQPQLKRIVIKLNDGFSGEGNAILELNYLAAFSPANTSHAARIAAISRQFEKLSFQSATETWPYFRERIPEMGALAEAFIEGRVKRSRDELALRLRAAGIYVVLLSCASRQR